MLDFATTSIMRQLFTRIRSDTAHRDYFVRAVESAFGVADRFEAERDRILRDGRFSDVGKREAVAELVRDRFAPELASGAGKTARHAAQRNESRRAAIGRPSFDKSDLAAAMERREVRDYVRSRPEGQRFQTALELVKDRRMAEAILSGPGTALTGLTPQQFEQVHQQYLQWFFADELREVDAMRDDVTAVAAAVKIARDKLLAASGMSTVEFDAFWSTLELAADKS